MSLLYGTPCEADTDDSRDDKVRCETGIVLRPVYLLPVCIRVLSDRRADASQSEVDVVGKADRQERKADYTAEEDYRIASQVPRESKTIRYGLRQYGMDS